LKQLLTVTALLCVLTGAAQGATSVCAMVKIQIQQELTLERQGFDAHINISNGLSTITLQNVD